MSFTKADFEAANDGSSGGDFPTIAPGIYTLELNKFFTEDKDSGAKMVNIGWQISPESEIHANQFCFSNQCLRNKTGEVNTIGLQVLNQLLYRISENQFDMEDFQWHPESGECTNENDVLEKFLGTKVVGQVTSKVTGEYTNYTVKVRSVEINKYQSQNGAKSTTSSENLQQPASDYEAKVEDKSNDSVQAVKGMAIMATVKGKPLCARVITVVEGTAPGHGMVRCWPVVTDSELTTKLGKDIIMVNESEIQHINGAKVELFDIELGQVISGDTPKPEAELVVEDDLLEEEVLSKPLEVGAKATYEWEGKSLTEVIHKIDENSGTVQFKHIKENGKAVGRTVNMTTVVPF